MIKFCFHDLLSETPNKKIIKYGPSRSHNAKKIY